jgi:hypothetical protein
MDCSSRQANHVWTVAILEFDVSCDPFFERTEIDSLDTEDACGGFDQQLTSVLYAAI